jgi:hypothetical protein
MVFLPGPHFIRLAVATVVYGGLLATIFLLSGLVRLRDVAGLSKVLLGGWRTKKQDNRS